MAQQIRLSNKDKLIARFLKRDNIHFEHDKRAE